ncbi:MAG: hypothetical protein QGF53_16150 [Alphaproteobacteria bacterium]|nr:hypothetical protein [Alphaproteobacteria bacterium]
MTVPISDQLVAQAELLIDTRDSDPPSQADLRRAISNAYYAVFHAIASQAADAVVGKASRKRPRYELVYRSIDHSRLKKICAEVKKPLPQQKLMKYVPKKGFGQHLTALAAAVIDLQERRNLADYDPQYRVEKSDAIMAISTCRDALERFGKANAAARNSFLYLLLFSPR